MVHAIYVLFNIFIIICSIATFHYYNSSLQVIAKRNHRELSHSEKHSLTRLRIIVVLVSLSMLISMTASLLSRINPINVMIMAIIAITWAILAWCERGDNRRQKVYSRLQDLLEDN